MSEIERYYEFHAKIYDLTRWLFLVGREEIVDLAAAHSNHPLRILEVGVGTGVNLKLLCRHFPKATITAVDLSQDMLDRARAKVTSDLGRVTFLKQAYDRPLDPGQTDLVLFSYSLSMMNPGWEEVIRHAATDLRPGGRIAVTDFHAGHTAWFRRWMGVNHVRMDGHLLPSLQATFSDEVAEVKSMCPGLWSVLLYVGRKE